MSAWTKHNLTFTRATANADSPWMAAQGTPAVIGPLVCGISRRLARSIEEIGSAAAEAVPETIAVVIYINQSDNTTALWDKNGVPIVQMNDLVKQTDSLASQLNGHQAVVTAVRDYDGQLQLNVRVGTT